MRLTWFGHSFFLLESENGTRIATDPHDPPTGYDDPHIRAHAVTLSHTHHDHAYLLRSPGATVIDHKDGVCSVGDVTITAFASFHDDVSGAKRGINTIYVFGIDNVRVAHLGDLGHLLSQKTMDAMGNIDVLLIPVGGVYTIDGAQAAVLARHIGAPVVIPMHYQTAQLTFALDGVEKFLAHVETPIVQAGHTLPLNRDALTPGIYLMNQT